MGGTGGVGKGGGREEGPYGGEFVGVKEGEAERSGAFQGDGDVAIRGSTRCH